MSRPSDGGPAFPIPSDGVQHGTCPGMTLRDYFAAKALGAVALRAWEDEAGQIPPDIFDRWAVAAYKAADAMLAERAKAGDS